MPKLSRDGINLAYEEAGQGDPPLVFIHGFSCNRSYFAPQAAYFSKTHRTISVDLRGHGESDAPEGAYDTDTFADDVAWLCEQLGASKPVVAGHSMGAGVALQLAARRPDFTTAIILIDGGTRSLVPSPDNPNNPMVKLIEALRADDLPLARELGHGMIQRMFGPVDDPERRAKITEEMLAVPPHVKLPALLGLRSLDSEAAVKALTVPMLFIQAGAERPEMERLRQMLPDAVIGRTVGAGHFNMLEVPEQVNSMIDRFLQTISR